MKIFKNNKHTQMKIKIEEIEEKLYQLEKKLFAIENPAKCKIFDKVDLIKDYVLLLKDCIIIGTKIEKIPPFGNCWVYTAIDKDGIINDYPEYAILKIKDKDYEPNINH